MGMSVSGVTPAATVAVQSPAAPQPNLAGKAEAPLDFGPAVSFTPTAFDQAVIMQMYNASGASIALTQLVRSGTLPAPGTTRSTTEVEA